MVTVNVWFKPGKTPTAPGAAVHVHRGAARSARTADAAACPCGGTETDCSGHAEDVRPATEAPTRISVTDADSRWEDTRQTTFDLEAGEKWITVHPHGKEVEGHPALVSGSKGHYTVRGGMGGKYTGKPMAEATKAGREAASKHKLASGWAKLQGEPLGEKHHQYAEFVHRGGPERIKEHHERLERELAQQELEHAAKRETDLSKQVTIGEGPMQGSTQTAGRWIQILADAKRDADKAIDPDLRERLNSRSDNIRKALTDAGYDVPAEQAKHAAERNKPPPGPDPNNPMEVRSYEQLPKTATGEVDYDKIEQDSGITREDAYDRIKRMGWNSFLVSKQRAEEQRWRRQREQEILDKRKAEQTNFSAKYKDVSPQQRKLGKPVSDLGVRLAALGEAYVNRKYKPAGTTVPLTRDHELAVGGITEAFKEMPEFNNHYSFLIVENPSGKNTVMSAGPLHSGGHTITINTSCDTLTGSKTSNVIDRVMSSDPAKQMRFYTVSTLGELRKQPGVTRDDLIKQYYKECAYHEMGHILDQHQAYGITRQINAALSKKLKSKKAQKEWVRTNISEYATTSDKDPRGWVEVTAELYAMKRLGKPIPDELKHIDFGRPTGDAETTQDVEPDPDDDTIDDTFLMPWQVIGLFVEDK